MSQTVYIHIPFCKRICYYCDFCRQVYQEQLADRYIITLQNEIEANLSINETYQTFYIGGGTPSSLSIKQLVRLLEILKPYQRDVAEYTIECNPEDLIDEKIEILRCFGINRISIGVQSSSNKLLKSVNRMHTFRDVHEGILRLHKQGIYNISVDLIYGLPSQSMEDWIQALQDVSKLDIQHISLYSLTIEPNSVFGKKGIQKIDDDLEADMYEYTIRFLIENGYKQYEVSNFCKDNSESRHNFAYWKYDDFIGLGVGASGKEKHYRYTNTSNIKEYISSFKTKEYYHLNRSEQIFEYVMMNLRTTEGILLQHFNDVYGISFLDYFKNEIDILLEKELIEFDEMNSRINCKKMILLNEVLLQFLNI